MEPDSSMEPSYIILRRAYGWIPGTSRLRTKSITTRSGGCTSFASASAATVLTISKFGRSQLAATVLLEVNQSSVISSLHFTTADQIRPSKWHKERI